MEIRTYQRVKSINEEVLAPFTDEEVRVILDLFLYDATSSTTELTVHRLDPLNLYKCKSYDHNKTYNGKGFIDVTGDFDRSYFHVDKRYVMYCNGHVYLLEGIEVPSSVKVRGLNLPV